MIETGCLVLCSVRNHFLNFRDLFNEKISGAFSPPSLIDDFSVVLLTLSFGRVDLADQINEYKALSISLRSALVMWHDCKK